MHYYKLKEAVGRMIKNEVPRWTRLSAADQGLASNCVFRSISALAAYIRRRPMVIISLLASDCSLPRLEATECEHH